MNRGAWIGDAPAVEVDAAFADGLSARLWHGVPVGACPSTLTGTRAWAWRWGWALGGVRTGRDRRRYAFKVARLAVVEVPRPSVVRVRLRRSFEARWRG